MFRPVVALAVPVITIAGCMTTDPELRSMSALEENEYREGYEYLLEDLWSQQTSKAILTHRTIFPYHFEDGTNDLNELGAQSLDVLATLYRENPGSINVRMGKDSPELYEARVESVLAFLEGKGVDRRKMEVVDGHMGGEGAWSVRAILADNVTQITADKKETSTGTTTSGLTAGIGK